MLNDELHRWGSLHQEGQQRGADPGGDQLARREVEQAEHQRDAGQREGVGLPAHLDQCLTELGDEEPDRRGPPGPAPRWGRRGVERRGRSAALRGQRRAPRPPAQRSGASVRFSGGRSSAASDALREAGTVRPAPIAPTSARPHDTFRPDLSVIGRSGQCLQSRALAPAGAGPAGAAPRRRRSTARRTSGPVPADVAPAGPGPARPDQRAPDQRARPRSEVHPSPLQRAPFQLPPPSWSPAAEPAPRRCRSTACPARRPRRPER